MNGYKILENNLIDIIKEELKQILIDSYYGNEV